MPDVQNERVSDQVMEYPPVLDEVADDVLAESQAAFRSEPALSETGGGGKHRVWKREVVRQVLEATTSSDQFAQLARGVAAANEGLKASPGLSIPDLVVPVVARLLATPAINESSTAAQEAA